MKYIKKFNEDLSPHIYKRAAAKLNTEYTSPISRKVLNIDSKIDNLNKHSEMMYKRDQIEQYNKTIEKMSNTPTISINGLGDCYVDISFDEGSYDDNFEDFLINENEVILCFHILVVPKDKNIFLKALTDKSYLMYNGYILFLHLSIKYIVKDNISNIDSIRIRKEDGSNHITDRSNLVKLKRIINSVFTETSNILYDNNKSIYDFIQHDILQKYDLENTYNLTMDKIKEDVSKIKLSQLI